jgi:hypothetical protein
MRLRIENIKESPLNLLRRAGYVFQRNEQDPPRVDERTSSRVEAGEMSFVRAMARSGYPRFHMFAHLEGSDLVINFHLDQKKETYGAATRHHGEYEDEGALKIEAERIQKLLF